MSEPMTPGPYAVGYESLHVDAVDPYGHGLMKVYDVRGWGHLTGLGACGFDFDKAKAIQEANARNAAAIPNMIATLEAYEAADKHSDTCHLCIAHGACPEGARLYREAYQSRVAVLNAIRGTESEGA